VPTTPILQKIFKAEMEYKIYLVPGFKEYKIYLVPRSYKINLVFLSIGVQSVSADLLS